MASAPAENPAAIHIHGIRIGLSGLFWKELEDVMF